MCVCVYKVLVLAQLKVLHDITSWELKVFVGLKISSHPFFYYYYYSFDLFLNSQFGFPYMIPLVNRGNFDEYIKKKKIIIMIRCV